MSRTHNICIFLSLTWILTCSTFLLTLAAADEKQAGPAAIKLGYVLDLSGKGAFFGLQTRRGAELALRELKAMGHNVQVVFGDTQSVPRLALGEATRMLEVEHVDAFLCDLTPACTAIAETVERAGKVMIYHAPVSSIAKANAHAFRNFIDYRHACRIAAEYFLAHGIGPIASINPTLEFGLRCRDGITDLLPQHLAIEYESGDDLRAGSIRLKQRGIAALIQTGYEGDIIQRFQRSHEIAHQIQTAIVEVMLSSYVIDKLGSLLDGTILLGFKTVSDDFRRRLLEIPSKTDGVDSVSALSYRAVLALDSALRACSSRTADCVAESLRKIPPDPLFGFRGWQSGAAEPEYDIQLKRWQKGKVEILPRG